MVAAHVNLVRAPNRQRVISAHRRHKGAANVDAFGSGNVVALGSPHLNCQRAANHRAAVSDHLGHIVRADVQIARQANVYRRVHADILLFVLLGQAPHVALRLLPVLLQPRLILKANPVIIALATADGSGNKTALGRVGGQIPGRHSHVVIERARDERPVRIAVNEVNNHLMTDARDVDPAKVIASPGLANAQPAGVRLAVFTIAIPEKTHLHPAIFIGPDILSRRPHHQRRLRTAGFGFRHGHRVAVNFIGWLNAKLAAVAKLIRRSELVDLFDQQLAA